MPDFSDLQHRIAITGAVVVTAALVAATARAEQLTLNCYVFQTGANSTVQFVRHLQADTEDGTVSVSDSVGGGRLKFIGTGRLVSLDADHLVFDFASQASAGRTEVDRQSGAFNYADGRSVVRGTCQPGQL